MDRIKEERLAADIKAREIRGTLEDPAGFDKDLEKALDNCEGEEYEAGCILEVCDKYLCSGPGRRNPRNPRLL